jgi:hydroxyacyl-ACP dehydratase HTD2-like protein with hotdog domain
MSGLLSAKLLAHIGRSGPAQTEIVSRRDIRKYAIATGQRQRRHLDGDVAPPLYYMALFWPVVELSELTPDGVFVDPLVPELPLKRAMAGGVRVEYFRDIRPGDTLTATRTLTNLYEKQGSSGPLIFYEIVTRITSARDEPVLTETATRIMR